MNETIKFPTKKYLNAKEYFIKYINIKNLLLQKVDQKILNKINLEILHAAKKKRNFFSCGNGDDLKKLSDYNINFLSNNFGIVQDCHLSIFHIISQYIRNINFTGNKKNINVNY